jgi:uncharacterized protein
MEEAHTLSGSISHAYRLVGQELHTLCGRLVADLKPGESALDGSTASSLWITCPTCKNATGKNSLSIEDYAPRSSLVVPASTITTARYPFLDVHNHLNTQLSDGQLNALVSAMDSLNLRVMVNLSGGTGALLNENCARIAKHQARFLTFANIDFTGLNDPGFSSRAARQLEKDAVNGARGLKIFKSFGTLKDGAGNRIPVDDPRFDEVFEVCANLHLPVLIHTADPKPFFEPVDQFNERFLELTKMSSRVPAKGTPDWEVLIAEQHRLFARHSDTTFINAHLGWLGNNLEELGRLLERQPNVYTEFSAVIPELARQPRHARTWFLRYQDRVLFGKDTWNPSEYQTYFRVLETADEYFDHFRRYQAGWKLYGLKLPDRVLRKVYFENALRILPSVDSTLFTS